MEPVVGIFVSRSAAELAARNLRAQGWPPSRVRMLPPERSAEIEAMPVEDAEQPGVGRALGGVLAAAVGATAGMGLGAVAGSSATGLAAAIILGILGAVVGVAVSGALEKRSQRGLPHDEVYVYEDALEHGRSVVFALAKSRRESHAARRALEDAGAESLDAARDEWWIGLRDAEKAHYEASGGDWASAEAVYRQGFAAAHHPALRDRTFEDARRFLEDWCGAVARKTAFRRGYERGQERRRKNPPGRTAAK
jgi:uncharacterized membrane protein YeaQ/YmgE (transglycosylase-associated protein family)